MIIRWFAKLMMGIFALCKISLILLILLTLLGFATPYIAHLNKYPYVQSVLKVDNFLNDTTKHYLPTEVAGKDISRILTIVVLLILLEIIKSIIHYFHNIHQRHLNRMQLKNLNQAHLHLHPDTHANTINIIAKKMKPRHEHPKNRHHLLKEFVNIKKELEKIGRDLTFLAIDVVDSTNMKQGEDKSIVQHDFLEYHHFVEAKFKEHGLIKASWTPDGVMACFNTIEDAILSAQAILHGLEYFNQHVKVMKRDFIVRCGINSGHVYYDDSIPLEQFSDRTIDIAGHMQKHAAPNSILIAKQIIEPVTTHGNFIKSERIIDGLEVCEWNKKIPDKTAEQ